MRKPESSIKMSTAKLVQLKIGGNFPYAANMWPTITQRAAIPRRPSRYPMWVKVVCFIIRLRARLWLVAQQAGLEAARQKGLDLHISYLPMCVDKNGKTHRRKQWAGWKDANFVI